jgi:hypothetical protein
MQERKRRRHLLRSLSIIFLALPMYEHMGVWDPCTVCLMTPCLLISGLLLRPPFNALEAYATLPLHATRTPEIDKRDED